MRLLSLIIGSVIMVRGLAVALAVLAMAVPVGESRGDDVSYLTSNSRAEQAGQKNANAGSSSTSGSSVR